MYGTREQMSTGAKPETLAVRGYSSGLDYKGVAMPRSVTFDELCYTDPWNGTAHPLKTENCKLVFK